MGLALDGACSHTGKVSQQIHKIKKIKGFLNTNWSPMNFEAVADDIDKDTSLSGSDELLTKYRRYGRPYLVSSGIEDGIKFIFTMSPFMSKIESEADFISHMMNFNTSSVQLHLIKCQWSGLE